MALASYSARIDVKGGRTMIVTTVSNEFHIRVASFFRAPDTMGRGGTGKLAELRGRGATAILMARAADRRMTLHSIMTISSSQPVITTGPFLRRLWWHTKKRTRNDMPAILQLCIFSAPREFPTFFPDADFSGFRPAPEMSPKTRVAETA